MNKEKLFLEAITLLIKDMNDKTNFTYSDIYKMLYEKYYELNKESGKCE